MKLISKYFNKDGTGQVALQPEEPEDMWHAYNLVAVGDSLRSTTVRKVQTETATGSSTSNRVRTTLTISVEEIFFDTQVCQLRVSGRNIQENQYVKMGAYHTLDLEMNRKFTLAKQLWDLVAMERVDLACDPSKTADLAAIVMQEGLCHICLITSSMTIVKAKIEVNIPRKRASSTQKDKAMVRFNDAILQAMIRHLNFEVLKCILVASPGFVKDQFMSYLVAEAIKTDNKLLFENKNKFVMAKSSSGYKHSLQEVLSDPDLQGRLADTKATGEVRALRDFHRMMEEDEERAAYGMKPISLAIDNNAVDVLLLSDKLFRSQDVQKRKSYVRMVEAVRDVGGTVRIFSSLHISGEHLDNLGGLAAILRFPMPELDDLYDSD